MDGYKDGSGGGELQPEGDRDGGHAGSHGEGGGLPQTGEQPQHGSDHLGGGAEPTKDPQHHTLTGHLGGREEPSTAPAPPGDDHTRTYHLGGREEPSTAPAPPGPSHLGGGAEPLGPLGTTTHSATGKVGSSSSFDQKRDEDISDMEGTSPNNMGNSTKDDDAKEGSSAGTSSQASQSKRARSRHKGRGNKQPPKQSRRTRTHEGERRAQKEKDASSATSSTEGETRINKEALARLNTRTRRIPKHSPQKWANWTDQEVAQRKEALGDSPQWRTPESENLLRNATFDGVDTKYFQETAVLLGKHLARVSLNDDACQLLEQGHIKQLTPGELQHHIQGVPGITPQQAENFIALCRNTEYANLATNMAREEHAAHDSHFVHRTGKK